MFCAVRGRESCATTKRRGQRTGASQKSVTAQSSQEASPLPEDETTGICFTTTLLTSSYFCSVTLGMHELDCFSTCMCLCVWSLCAGEGMCRRYIYVCGCVKCV